jgi:putative CocE/NonD family hydrolase
MCMLSLINSKMPPLEIKNMLDRLTYLLDNIDEQCYFLPVTESPGARIGEELGMEPSISEFLENMKNDDYWINIKTVADFEDIDIPVFHISGWYDQFCSKVLESYQGMKTRGGSEIARKNQKLLMGPWFHGTALASNVGSLDFGLASAGPSIDVTGIHIRWFDYWLKGIDNGIMSEPVRIFVMGDNVWRNEKDWPLQNTEYTRYYFHSKGQSNSRYGNGVLSTAIPEKEPDDVFLYDPRNPVPYKWDIPSSGYAMFAVQEQEEVEKRPDVLVYTSVPLERDLEVIGNVEIKLWAASSAIDTDFTGKLVDVWPDGKAYNLTDGIVRARYRNSTKEPEFIEPGKVYEYTIELQPTSNVFKAGHRIRVQISSSNFPKYDRNLNTGNKIGQDDKIEVAMQTILHNNIYPSHIILPVISR